MMESIGKLRDLLKGCGCSDKCYSCGINFHGNIADEIEAEIAEKYMELPVDADGVPIRVGDVMTHKLGTGERKDIVEAVYENGFLSYRSDGYWHHMAGDTFIHVKPRTIEEVLRDVWKEALDYAKGGIWRNPDEVFVERAAEIRKLMGVDD